MNSFCELRALVRSESPNRLEVSPLVDTRLLHREGPLVLDDFGENVVPFTLDEPCQVISLHQEPPAKVHKDLQNIVLYPPAHFSVGAAWIAFAIVGSWCTWS